MSVKLNELDPNLRLALDAMKDQLLIILIDKLGGDVTVTVDEIDTATIGRGLSLDIDYESRTFKFQTGKL